MATENQNEDQPQEQAPPVTSTVEVQGTLTIRTYSDGAVQRNVWETPERAQEYADSVHEQEGE